MKTTEVHEHKHQAVILQENATKHFDSFFEAEFNYNSFGRKGPVKQGEKDGTERGAWKKKKKK